MLFLSQPLGVGFSYPSRAGGRPDPARPAPVIIDTSAKAASAAWAVLQAFVQALPAMDPVVQTRTVHLWTER